MAEFTGKTAVVVGASGETNLGVAIARSLAAAGAHVVVAARREEPLQALAAEIGGTAVACDVTDEGQMENLFARASEATGKVDIAVYSAGVLASTPIAELTVADIQPTLDVSFIGALLFFKHAAAAMPEGGSVITISSLTARLPGPELGVYAAARAGIDFAIRVAAVEYADQKVRFNSIAAGLIETDMTGLLFQMDGVVEAHLAATPCRRMGTPDDIAQAALFLADERRSGYLNGQVLDVSGGQHNGKLPSF